MSARRKHVAPVLRLVPTPEKNPRAADQADVIACLTNLLDRAKRGQISGIAYAVTGDAENSMYFSACGKAHRDTSVAVTLSSILHHGQMRRVFGDE